MTSKLVVNTIEADTGISSVSFASSISMSSTSKFHFSAAGIDIGADTNISRPAAGVLGFNISGAEKLRIDTNGHLNTSGIVTAANFKTGVTNLHSTGLTLTGGQLDVGSNIKVGTAGVITATSFVGSGANLTGITQTTINNNADNRIITGSGTANTLNGEAGLTYNGQAFQVNSVTSENNAFRVYNTTTNATTFHINGEGNSFQGHTYPLTDSNLDLGYHATNKWRDVVLSGGIRFGSASADHYLDKYEEGTFTPTVLNGWGILNSNPEISTGKYIRIGAIVYIYFTFKEGSGRGSFNGNRLALYTFPFNPDGTFGSGGGNNFSHPLQAYTNSNSSNAENVIGVPGNNGATVFSYITKASNGYGSFTGTNLGSSGQIFCAGVYRITGT